MLLGNSNSLFRNPAQSNLGLVGAFMQKKDAARKPVPNHDLELGIALIAIILIVAITLAGKYGFVPFY